MRKEEIPRHLSKRKRRSIKRYYHVSMPIIDTRPQRQMRVSHHTNWPIKPKYYLQPTSDRPSSVNSCSNLKEAEVQLLGLQGFLISCRTFVRYLHVLRVL